MLKPQKPASQNAALQHALSPTELPATHLESVGLVHIGLQQQHCHLCDVHTAIQQRGQLVVPGEPALCSYAKCPYQHVRREHGIGQADKVKGLEQPVHGQQVKTLHEVSKNFLSRTAG